MEQREHIVHLDHVACPIHDIVCHTIAVDGKVYKVDSYVRAHCYSRGRPNALSVERNELELEKYERYTEFEHMREIIENEYPACYFSRCHRCVEYKRGECADRPKHKHQVAERTTNRIYARRGRMEQIKDNAIA